MTETNTPVRARASVPAPVIPNEDLAPGHVWVRVMRKGHDKISTGELQPLVADNMFPRHPMGAVIQMPQASAEKFEEVDGWVEIL